MSEESMRVPSSRPNEPGVPVPTGTGIPISDALATLLRPWVDVREVGSEGLETWFRSILSLIPRPGAGGEERPSADPHERAAELARALSDCASDRARAHFQASEYFRENRALARRVGALEAALEARRAAGDSVGELSPDAEVDRASQRYLPSRETRS